MRPDALLELGGVSLDPAVDGRVVPRHAAVGQHPLEVAVADRELQVPAHRPEDDLRRELPTLERVLPAPRQASALLIGAAASTRSQRAGKPCNRTFLRAVARPALPLVNDGLRDSALWRES